MLEQGSLWPGVVAADRVLYIGQIELNCILELNGITWNRTILTFKLHTYYKLNCLKLNCFGIYLCLDKNNTYTKLNCLNSSCLTKLNSLKKKCFWQLHCVLMLNWIILNGTVFDIETVLTLNWIVWNRTAFV